MSERNEWSSPNKAIIIVEIFIGKYLITYTGSTFNQTINPGSNWVKKRSNWPLHKINVKTLQLYQILFGDSKLQLQELASAACIRWQ